MTQANTREQELGVLFNATVKALLQRIKSGDASPQDFKNAIQLLKDNNITCEVRRGNNLGKLAEILPFSSADFEQVN